MGLEILTLGSSKTYTRESLLGGGAVVGKNVTISSITPIEGGNRITFSYTLDNGTVKTSTMDVMDGKDGIDGINGTNGKDGQPGKDGTDGIGISKIEKIGTVDLVDTYRITFTDNSTFDYEVKNGADGTGGTGASTWSEISDKPFESLSTDFSVENGELKVVGGTGGEENKIDSISVNGVKVSVDENKNVDITVPSIEGLTKDADLSTVAKSGSYEDLINKPTIPDITGLATETYVDNKVADYTKTVDLADVATSGSYNDLADKPTIPSLDGYAKTTEIPSKVSQLENDSNYLSSIPEEYVTDTELEAKGYLTEHQDISGKVDKVEGKSLISDTEIARLASVDNYDDTAIKAEIAKKADATAIPSKVSELTNDSNYQTDTDVTTALTPYATKTYVGEQISNADHLKREIVTEIPKPETADKNTIYMLKIESVTGNDKYREYLLIDGTVQCVGDTSVDLTDYAKTTDVDKKLNNKADKTEIPTELPANGGNADTVNNHTVKSDVPENAVFTDTTYSDATQIEHGLMSVDDKKKLDGLKKYTPDGSTITADEDGTLHGVAKVTVDDTLSSTSTNPVQNKVVKAYVDKKVSENVDFSTSTSKTLNDTVEAPLMIGKATRNLLNPSLQTTTQNGVTCTNNGDGTYTFNGTAADTATFIVQAATDMSKEYIHKDLLLAGCPEGGSIGTYRLQYWNNVADQAFDFGNSSKFQIKHIPREANIAIIIDKGFKANNLLFKPMLTTDLSATYDDFVPYSGYDIKTCGKNLFNGKYIKELVSIGTDYTNRNLYDEFSSVNDITGLEYVVFGGYFRKGKYTLSYSNDAWFSFNRVAIAGTACIELLKSIRKTYTWEQTQDGYTYFSIEADDSETGTVDVPFSITPDIQIEKGSAATSYKPYQDSDTVNIDSSTEFPLLGLKSFDGETNIISPGNVEVTYAKSDSGKAILDMSENKLDKDNVANNQTTTEAGFALDARQANPNIDGTLAKQISDLNGSLNNVFYGFIHRGVIDLWKTNTDISKGIGIYNIYEIDSEYWKSLYSGNDLQNVGDFTLCMFDWNSGDVATMNIVKFGTGFLMSARSVFLAYVTVWDGNFNLHKV